LIAVIPLLLALVALGCAPPAPVTNSKPKARGAGSSSGTTAQAIAVPQGPKTLSEAVKAIGDTYAKIKTAFDEKAPDKAHDPMHEIGELLEGVPVLASKASLEPAKLEGVTASVKTLIEQFTKIDDKMHGKEGAEFNEVSGKIEDALKALQGVIQ
jgi:hypothetical protein